uniref:Variant surface glycoprotein n=1 Tax=Trypanosoma brucei TaxID=5691 RepID=A0A1V0G0B4_9TRYP|nr:variant surface glycoprotein [Trypanosoma brucei]
MPPPPARFLAQLLFAAMFTLIKITAQDADLDAAADKVSGPCDEAAYLSKLLQGWKGELGQKLASVKQHEEDALTWRLAAAASGDSMGARARSALALLSETRARKSATAATQAETKLGPAIATITARLAAVTAVAKAHPGDTITARSANTVETNPAETSGTSAACPITFTMNSAIASCDLNKIAGTDSSTLEADTKTKRHIKLLPDSFFKPTKLKVRALAKGAPATASNLDTNDNGHCHGGDSTGLPASENNVLTAFISPQPGNTRTPTKQEHSTIAGGSKKCADDEANPADTNPTLKHTLHVICQASSFQSRTPTRTTAGEGPALADDGDMQNIARFLLFSPAEIAAIPVAEQTTKIQEKIKSVYGDKNGEFKKNYLQPLQEKQLTFKLGSNQESKSINAIVQGSDAEIVLSYFLGQQYDQNQRKGANTTLPTKEEKTDTGDKTEEKKDGDNKTNATDCTGAEEGKCDKTKCDWNAEKKQCKVKEGAAVISYVMKAPLLLAFLLF